MKIFTSKILDYLKDVIPNFKLTGKLFTCPVCRKVKANLISNSDKIFCLNCHKNYGDIFDIIKLLEVNKYKSTQEMVEYLASKFNIEYITEESINKALDFYKASNFDLLPVVGNTKIPGEKEWTIKEHKNKDEWLSWIKDGLNVGIKTGERSKITVLDFDTKEIDYVVKQLLNDTLKVETERGWHFVYDYEPDLNTTRIDDLKLDLMNIGKQFVVFPSKIDGKRRKQLQGSINKMSIELLSYLKRFSPKTSIEILSEKTEELINSDITDINFNYIGEGNRNHFLLHLGGILSKQMNTVQVENTLSVVNRLCCKPPYPQRELENIIKSLDRYENKDEKHLASKILSYLKIVSEASSRDVKEIVGESKEKVDKALECLVREGYAIKKRKEYHVLKKIEWKDTFYTEDTTLNFKVPYFYDIATFRSGDLILIGGNQKSGKCIAEGYIITRNGIIDIKEFGKNFPEGLSELKDEHIFYGRKKYYFKVAYFYKEKVNKTIKIKTDYGFELEGTPEHPILCYNDNKSNFKKLEEIKIGDKVIIGEGFNSTIKNKELLKYCSFNRNKNDFTTNNILLPYFIDENISRLLGYFVADGNFLSSNGIEITNAKEYIIKDIENICNKYEFSYTISHQKGCQRIRIKSSLVYTLFVNIFQGKPIAKDKHIPSLILESSSDIQKEFLSAYLSCDTYLNECLNIYTASKILASQLQILLLCFGIFSKKKIKIIKKYLNRHYYILTLNKEHTIKLLSLIPIAKYKDNNFQLKYKIERPLKIEENLYINEIIYKEEINEEKYVYDFNIPDYHAFWSNGFISHNSHVALNIIKQLVEQGIKPYYLNLEAGNRFAKIAKQLQMKDGDFFNTTYFYPEMAELEDNAITILDWLLPKDYSNTDKIFQHFAEQLFKHGGLLFVFVQLRGDGNFFAKDMIAMFPSFVCRYILDKDSDGKDISTQGRFLIDHIRESKKYVKKWEVPCRYSWETKKLTRMDELDLSIDNKSVIIGKDLEVIEGNGEEFIKEINE